MCTQPQTAVPNGNSRGAHCCSVHQAEIFHWQRAQKTQRPDHVNDRCWVNSQRCRSKMSPSDSNKTNDIIKHKNADVFPCLLLSRNTSKMLNESRSGLKTTASDVAAASAWPAADRYEAFLTSLWTGSDCLWVLDPRRRSALNVTESSFRSVLGWCSGSDLNMLGKLAHLSKFPQTWVEKRTVDSCRELQTKEKAMRNIDSGFRRRYQCEHRFQGRVQEKKKAI